MHAVTYPRTSLFKGLERAGAARPEIEKREALEDLDPEEIAALQRAVSQMSQR